MDTERINYNRFDQVKIITTRNVVYLHAPPGEEVLPDGLWQVSAMISNDLLLVKNNITIRIPATDVLKVFDYDIDTITAHFGRLSEYGQEIRKEAGADEHGRIKETDR